MHINRKGGAQKKISAHYLSALPRLNLYYAPVFRQKEKQKATIIPLFSG